MTKANGESFTCKLSEITVHDHNDSQLTVLVQGNKRYFMRINSVDVDTEVDQGSNRYLEKELLFAALNQYTEGIYIREDETTTK